MQAKQKHKKTIATGEMVDISGTNESVVLLDKMEKAILMETTAKAKPE